jgi:hypothetical protein
MMTMTAMSAYMAYTISFLFFIMLLYFSLHSSEQNVSETGIALPQI